LKTQAKASAPAKVILLGEHFVVHGAPAIVLAIDKRATAQAQLRRDKQIFISSKAISSSGYFSNGKFHVQEGGKQAKTKLEPIYKLARNLLNLSKKDVGINLKIDSSIPVAAGLGSSAAVAVASAASLNHLLDAGLTKDDIFTMAFEAEKIIHGNPSGVDPAISTYGGVILYRRGEKIRKLDVAVDLPLVIGDTKIERSTGKMVTHVGDLVNRYPVISDKIIQAGEAVVNRSIQALEHSDLETLGEMMNLNHALLCAIGVSNEQLDRLVYAARKAGALGAKLTGAGGGGCMVALAYPENLDAVAEAINQSGGEAFITEKTVEGVRVES